MGVTNRFVIPGAIAASLCLLTAWLSLSGAAEANHPQTDRCVRPDGADGCYPTIQAAVDAAVDDDTITIAGGTYTESVLITRTLAISGGWQPTGWPLTETIVQADGADCAISLDTVSGSLNNLTATGAATVSLTSTSGLTKRRPASSGDPSLQLFTTDFFTPPYLLTFCPLAPCSLASCTLAPLPLAPCPLPLIR